MDAWNQGYCARYDGYRRESNPNYKNTDDWEEWDAGWFFADSEIRTG